MYGVVNARIRSNYRIMVGRKAEGGRGLSMNIYVRSTTTISISLLVSVVRTGNWHLVDDRHLSRGPFPVTPLFDWVLPFQTPHQIYNGFGVFSWGSGIRNNTHSENANHVISKGNTSVYADNDIDLAERSHPTNQNPYKRCTLYCVLMAPSIHSPIICVKA
jgi:hypothetical protein